MDIKFWQEIQNNDTLKKRLAKYMAQQCFRNTKLEDFHADPDSRLSDEEMEELMIDVVNHCYDFLTIFSGSQGEEIIKGLKQHDAVPEWNEPESANLAIMKKYKSRTKV